MGPQKSIERLLSKIKKLDSGCWEFLGSKDKGGYGKFHVNGAKTAHRSSWILHNGPIPPDRWVLHSCDTPACVNPAHLFLGDHWENMKDASDKGRLTGGGIVGKRVSDADVQLIRILDSMGMSRPILAEVLNLSHSTVKDIATRATYKKVKDSIKTFEDILNFLRA